MSLLGATLTAEGNHPEAESVLLEAIAALEDNPHAPAISRQRALQRIVQLYESWDKGQEAGRWRERLIQQPVRENS
jgi:hypothetical protein